MIFSTKLESKSKIWTKSVLILEIKLFSFEIITCDHLKNVATDIYNYLKLPVVHVKLKVIWNKKKTKKTKIINMNMLMFWFWQNALDCWHATAVQFKTRIV